MEITAFIAAIIMALFVARLLFPLFFDDSGEFYDCVCSCFTPDIVSLFRGELLENFVRSIQLSIYSGLVAASGFLTHLGIRTALTELISRINR